MLPPETGPINGTGVGGDAYMARHHGGPGVPVPPPGKVMLRAPFVRPPWRPTGDDLMHPAWGGARGVEPVHPGGEDFPIPGHLPPRQLDRGGVPVGQGGIVLVGIDPLARDLARYRQVIV